MSLRKHLAHRLYQHVRRAALGQIAGGASIQCLPDDALLTPYPVDLPWAGGLPDSALQTSDHLLPETA